MGLREYERKRDFSRTPEPSGRAHGSKKRTSKSGRSTKLSFVVQKHAASRLHYDFRLEHDGVLLSWAVPKGPSLDPADKRLAVHVEDHPLEYGGFEGTIPQGEYGGGSVIVWDRGRWIPDGDPAEGLRRGKLDFTLEGKKLGGAWHMVRLRDKDGSDKNWLLMKRNDDFVRRGKSITESRPESVKSGRLVEEIGPRSKVWRSNRSSDDPEPARKTARKRASKAGKKRAVTRRTAKERAAKPDAARRSAAKKRTAKKRTAKQRRSKQRRSKQRSAVKRTPRKSARKPAASSSRRKTGRKKARSVRTTKTRTRRRPAAALRTRVKGKARARKRSPAALAKGLERARATTLPGFVEPQLATLVESAPAGDAWVHEIKYDGYRTQARLEGGRVRWFSRRGLDWSARFAALSPAVAALPAKAALLDGEIVVLDKKGVSHFQNLQKALGDEDDGAMTYFAFDILHLDGLDLRRCQLTDRKDVLRALLAGVPAKAPLRYSEHIVGRGEEVHAQACRRKLEGIIAKRADSAYVSARSRDWLKVKCGLQQEFVIAGFTQPQGSRSGFGALVLGVHQRGKLRHAGRVGTGFDHKLLRDLRKRLDAMAIDAPPFDEALDASARRGVTWVHPRLVGEVAFTGWTSEGLLRHPSFLGLREDKTAAEVVKETPKPRPRAGTSRSSGRNAKKRTAAKRSAKSGRSGKGRG